VSVGGRDDPEPPLMTIRVSRDSGRTYGPRIDVRPTDNLQPDATSAWPPCQCPKHRTQSPAERRR
jgi:hypothetical protein